VSLTIGFATILVKRARSKGFLAVLAHEVLGVPLLTQRVDTLTLDGLVTPRAPCAERVVEAVLAVRASFFLEKGASGKWAQALAAYEVVRMPLSVKCGDAFSGDWLVAVRAAGAEELLIASLAVRDPILLIEVACAQGYLAVATHEVFGMVGPIECLNHLSKDRLATVCAITARGWTAIEPTCGSPVDVPEHVVQIGTVQSTTRWLDTTIGRGRSCNWLVVLRLWLSWPTDGLLLLDNAITHWRLGVPHGSYGLSILVPIGVLSRS